MRVSAVGTADFAHRVPEHGRRHVVDRVQLIDVHALIGQVLANNPHGAKGVVEFLFALCRQAAVHVDAAIQRLRRRVVHGRDGTPERDATGILREVQRQDVLLSDRREVRGTTGGGGLAVLRGRVRAMLEAPVPRAAVASFADGDNMARVTFRHRRSFRTEEVLLLARASLCRCVLHGRAPSSGWP
jgi:hypothetical protein